jgi:putative flavoprotein involved in K+ transport
MNASVLDVIVIGAGHAGLSISYHLKELHLDHIVFEQAEIGNSWRNQRWDSFKLNTPNKFDLLPGENTFADSEGFSSASDFVYLLQKPEALTTSGRFEVQKNKPHDDRYLQPAGGGQ